MRRSILDSPSCLEPRLILPSAALAQGPPSPSFYVDGTLYRTVGTPTDLTNTGAPDSSFDTIYQFFGAQAFNVATAAPGDRTSTAADGGSMAWSSVTTTRPRPPTAEQRRLRR